MRTLPTFALALFISLGLIACSSNDTRGNAERAGASAGRAIDDGLITARVKAALVADPVTKARQINVETYQGVVQLSGFVDSKEARRRAVEIARDIDGVRRVKNSMELRRER
jgi:osmotically-inducible protein OsmY